MYGIIKVQALYQTVSKAFWKCLKYLGYGSRIQECRYLVVSVFSLPKSKEWEAIVPEDGDELIMRASGELNDIHFEFVKAYYILSYKECDAEATEQEKDSKSTDMESYFRILENLDSKYPKPDSPKFLLADILHHQSSEQ